MSLISRLSRRTSCCMTAISRSREFPAPTLGNVSSALRSDVSGFFEFVRDIGGETLDRVKPVIERLRHIAQRAGQVTDLVGSRGEIRDLLSRPDAAPHALRRIGEPADGFGDRIGEGERQNQHHDGEHQKEAQLSQTRRGDHPVNVAALGGEEERAAGRHHVLDRHPDVDDRFPPVVDAHQGLRFALQRAVDFRHRLAVGRPRIFGPRRGRGQEEPSHVPDDAIRKSAALRRIGQIRAHDCAAGRKRS